MIYSILSLLSHQNGIGIGFFRGTCSIATQELVSGNAKWVEVLPTAAIIVEFADVFRSNFSSLGKLQDFEQITSTLSADYVVDARDGDTTNGKIQEIGREFWAFQQTTDFCHFVQKVKIYGEFGKEWNGR